MFDDIPKLVGWFSLAKDIPDLIAYLNRLISSLLFSQFNGLSSVLTLIAMLLVTTVIAEIFIKLVRIRFIGSFVASMFAMWFYDQYFVKGIALRKIITAFLMLAIALAIIVVGIMKFLVKNRLLPSHFPKRG